MTEIKNEPVEKLKKMLEGIDFCMLTTLTQNKLHSRPMSTQEMESDGTLWFFTSENTTKVSDIEADDRVNIAYAKPDDNIFISVFGTAEVSKDRAKIDELWSPILKAWFPEGKDDPNLCLLKISIHEAEYWDSSSSTLVQIAGFVKALLTGKEVDMGENEKIRL